MFHNCSIIHFLHDDFPLQARVVRAQRNKSQGSTHFGPVDKSQLSSIMKKLKRIDFYINKKMEEISTLPTSKRIKEGFLIN